MSQFVPKVESQPQKESSTRPPSSSKDNPHRTREHDLLELLWEENQVPIGSQSTNSDNKSPPPQPSLPPLPPQPPPPPSNPPLYIAEDEMAAWLHYPLEDLYTDFLYPNPNDPSSSTQPPPPQPPPSPPAPPLPPRQLVVARSFQPFPRAAPRMPDQSVSPAGDITVVGSNESPATLAGGDGGGSGVGMRSGGGSGGSVAYNSSSSATESETATATTAATTVSVEDCIRKGRESGGGGGGGASTSDEGPSEDKELEVVAKRLKHPDGPIPRRTRAAEVHNLSERKRRDRINEKMKALQELIPHSNKSDKASMLDDAIDYMKSLQMQVQMMSMGCGMVPMMYPGMMQPRYVQPSGMTMSLATTSPQLPPMLPRATAYPMCQVPTPGFSVMQPNTTNSLIPFPSSAMQQYQPNVGNPYQQYMPLQPAQMQQMHVIQNPSPSQPASSSKASTSQSGKEHDDKKDG